MQQLTIQMRKPKIEQPQVLLLSVKRDTCERLFVFFYRMLCCIHKMIPCSVWNR